MDLYDRPDNQFVAGFIGSPSMNLITGEITSAGFATGASVLPLPEGAMQHNGRRAIYGVRPEHFKLAEGGVAAEVVLVEPMGSETQVTMLIGQTSVVGVFRERVALKAGETIGIQPDLLCIHLFASEGGQRLM